MMWRLTVFGFLDEARYADSPPIVIPGTSQPSIGIKLAEIGVHLNGSDSRRPERHGTNESSARSRLQDT
jgi:hypothetical protein